jgi:hypothetical protein
MIKNLFNPDFRDFLIALNQCEVEYILAGGYSVILHGYNRNTGDLDVWVRPSVDNYRRVKAAFYTFGMPLFDMTEQKFLDIEHYDVFSFGVPPMAIDLMTSHKGLEFDAAFLKARLQKVDDFEVRLIDLDDLIYAKKFIGRSKDLNDVENLLKKSKKN